MMYIGVRSCEVSPEVDNYWGSSKHLPKNVSEICDKFILGTFDTRQDAVADEIRRHNINDVVISDLFWNKAKQTSVGFDTSGTILSDEHRAKIKANGRKGITEEHKQKIADALRGKTKSEAHCKALSKARKGTPSPLKGMSIGKGRVLSEEHKQRIGLSNTGKKRTAEMNKAQSLRQKGKAPVYSETRYEKVKCPYCNKVGGKGNMTRYHFDNCKENT